jgi:hypothetical protein
MHAFFASFCRRRRTPNGERFLYPNLPASRPQEDG